MVAGKQNSLIWVEEGWLTEATETGREKEKQWGTEVIKWMGIHFQ